MADPSALVVAQELHQAGKLDEAIDVYLAVIKADRSLLDAWHLLAMAYTQAERYPQALSTLDQAIALDSTQVGFYNSRANVLLRLNRIEDAITTLQEAIAMAPDYAVAHNTLGRCYYLQQAWKLAEQQYQQAITLDDDFPQAHYNLALLFLQQDQLEPAIEQLNKTIALQPDFYRAHGQLGEALLQQAHYDLAIAAFLKRIEFQPHHADSYYSLGVAYLKTFQSEEACAAFEQALSLECQQPDLQHLLGNAYVQDGDPAKALSYYMRQLDSAPMMECYYNIGVILMHQDRNKDAITYLLQAKELDDTYLPVYINLGSIYLKMKKLDLAAGYYHQALDLDPDNEELRHILAAIGQGDVPDQAPATYIKHLFDQYAVYYDKHLTEVLDFSVPEQLHDAVDSVLVERDQTPNDWFVLDVGCGTGLAAPLFKPLSKRLVGIDLSEQMIRVAKTKDLYDELEVMDVNDIAQHYQDVDLIIASDVLAYMGNLQPIFNSFFSVLRPGGLLAFSVESTTLPDYILQTTVRYAHNKAYLQSTLEKSGFEWLSCQEHVIRTQQKQPVNGYLVVAGK